MNAVKQYWRGLETRERWLLLVGGGLVAVVLFYSLIWDPWHKAIKSLRVEVPSKFQDLVWLSYQKDQIRGLKLSDQKAQLAKPASLLTFIEQSSQKYGLRKSLNISPGRNKQTRITLKKVPYEASLGWLQELASAGLTLDAVLFKGAGDPGQVDVSLTVAS